MLRQQPGVDSLVSVSERRRADVILSLVEIESIAYAFIIRGFEV